MRTSHAPTTVPSRCRRGYLYVAVMMVSLMVSIMGFTAIRMAGSGMRVADEHADNQEAKLLARAAVEFGKNRVDQVGSWRSTFTSGGWSPPVPYGKGSFVWRLVDEDGNLADDPTDSVWVEGTGTVRGATYTERVRLIANGPALSCLGASLCTNANLSVGSFVRFTTDQFLHGNGNVSSSGAGALIEGDVRAAGTASGTISGAATSSVPPRTLPGSDAAHFYRDHGTWIDVDDLPHNLGSPIIDRAVLAPDLNPFGGGTNAEGIYVIDCRGESLTISDSRIVGTLVLLNPGSCRTSSSVHWDAAVPHYPALLVQGNFTFAHQLATNLSESSQGVNFNPAGAPYQGVADSDQSDSYPSRIRGLVHVSGTLTYAALSPASKVCGAVVAGAVVSNSNAEFDYSDVHLNHPPPGFRDGTSMVVSPSSWQRVVGP